MKNMLRTVSAMLLRCFFFMDSPVAHGGWRKRYTMKAVHGKCRFFRILQVDGLTNQVVAANVQN